MLRMLGVVMLNVVMLNVVLLSVLAPLAFVLLLLYSSLLQKIKTQDLNSESY
jgi:hypothetical protein